MVALETPLKKPVEKPLEDLPLKNWNEHTNPEEIIKWALGTYPHIIMPSGFNINGIVLLDMAVKAGYRGEVVFVDTGYHFKETLQTRDELALAYPQVSIVTISANREDDKLYEEDTDKCCGLRKVKPLQEYLAKKQPDAVFSARSHDQSRTRANLQFVEKSINRDKINPLIYLTHDYLQTYVKVHELTLNPLYYQGYLSIGCAPCTRAVKLGEDARAGRWADSNKTECGLWYGINSL